MEYFRATQPRIACVRVGVGYCAELQPGTLIHSMIPSRTLFTAGTLLLTMLNAHAQWLPGGLFASSVHFQACAFHHPDTGLFVYGANNPGPSSSGTEGGLIKTDNALATGGFYIWYQPSMCMEDVDVKMVDGQPRYIAAGHELYNRSVVLRKPDYTPNPYQFDSVRTGVGQYYRAVRMRNDLVAFAAGGTSNGNGIIDMSVDTGSTWANIAVLPGQPVSRLHFVNDQLGFAVTGGYSRLNNNGLALPDSGAIYRTTDGGLNWSQVHASAVAGFSDVDFVDASIGVATRNDGAMLRTTNGGTTWVPASVSISGNYVLTSVAFRADGTGFASAYRADGTEGLILSSSDAGATWGFNFSTSSFNHSRRIYDLYFFDDEHGYASTQIRPLRTDGLVTDVQEQTDASLRIFPNPLTGDVLTIRTADNATAQVELLDAAGRVVLTTRTAGRETVIDLGGLRAGTYVLRINDGSRVHTGQVVRM